MSIFGISSTDLKDYVTTEKDMLRRICKMPNAQFMIADSKIHGLDANQTNLEFDEGDELTGDDWVVISGAARPDLSMLNTRAKIARATLDLNSSESVALLIGKGND